MVKNIPDRINSTLDQSPAAKYDDAVLSSILEGAIDLHCHSGPSVMPRSIDHIEVMREGSMAKMKAILIKDHYYSATPVTELLMNHFQDLNVKMLSGVPLNNSTGGINRFAVDHGIKLGAQLVWMPTFSSRNHIAHHKSDKDFEKKFRKIAHQHFKVTNDPAENISNGRPWHSLFFEWEVSVHPISNKGNLEAHDLAYTPDFLSSAYILGENSSEYTKKELEVTPTSNYFSGRSILTPFAAEKLVLEIETYLAGQAKAFLQFKKTTLCDG